MELARAVIVGRGPWGNLFEFSVAFAVGILGGRFHHVADDADTTTVTLSTTAPATVVEGSTITYTATVDNAVTGSDLVLTLSNGQQITIAVGQTTGSVAYTVRADDAYAQGTSALPAVSITANAGGNFENVATQGTILTSVTDDADTSTVTLTGGAGTLTNGGQPVGEHCLVTGRMNDRVSTVDGQSYAIGFQMRLPTSWSGRFPCASFSPCADNFPTFLRITLRQTAKT